MDTTKLTREEALRRWNASKETKRKMVEKLETLVSLKSATYRVQWDFACKATKFILLYIFLAQQKCRRHKIPLPHKAT